MKCLTFFSNFFNSLDLVNCKDSDQRGKFIRDPPDPYPQQWIFVKPEKIFPSRKIFSRTQKLYIFIAL